MMIQITHGNKEHFAKTVCMFLADMLRANKISIQQSSQIAEQVIQNLNLIDNDEQFLKFVHELSKEYEELEALEQHVLKQKQINEHRSLETQVTEYAIYIMAQNSQEAAQILQEAVKPGVTYQRLCEQFPNFKQYLQIKT